MIIKIYEFFLKVEDKVNSMKKMMTVLIIGILVLSGFGTYVVAKTCIKINHAPQAPSITGPKNIKPNVLYEWTFKAIDPDGDNLYYEIDWEGDFVIDEQIGPFKSGEEINQSHSYDYVGSATIRARAIDVYGEISEWGEMPFDFLKDSQISNLVLVRRMIAQFIEH